MPRLGSKAAVTVPALTDVHTITQGGVDYSETNAQVLGLLAGGITNDIDTSGAITASGAITSGDDIEADGTLVINDTTDSTSKDTGSIITEGGIGAEGNIVSGGYIKPTLGLKPSVKIVGTDVLNSVIWAALEPLIPNVNDEIIISGGRCDTSSSTFVMYNFTNAFRYSSTDIFIEYTYMNFIGGVYGNGNSTYSVRNNSTPMTGSVRFIA